MAKEKARGTGEAGKITITPEMYPPLLEDVDFSIELVPETGTFRADNEDYSIHVHAEDMAKLERAIIEDIDFMVDMYLIQKKSKMAPDLKEVVAKLSRIIDVAKRPDGGHWDVDDARRVRCPVQAFVIKEPAFGTFDVGIHLTAFGWDVQVSMGASKPFKWDWPVSVLLDRSRGRSRLHFITVGLLMVVLSKFPAR